MKTIVNTIIALFLLTSLSANNVEITGLTQSGNTLTFQVSWDNSWRSGLEFHDAVWIFVKQAPNGGPSWIHANITSGLTDQGYQLVLPSDKVGVFLRRANNGNGTASAQVQLTIENPTGAYRDYKIFGTEMVYVPEGSFYVGDGISYETLHKGNDSSASYHVTSEAEITIGTGPGDMDGVIYPEVTSIPDTFPKGFAAFYSMKYKITQKQFVDFLNCLSEAAQDSLLPVDLDENPLINTFVLTETSSPVNGNGIVTDADTDGPHVFYSDLNDNGIFNETDDGQWRNCNWLSYYQILSFLDWSGLAPMSRFEYEKSCRGTLPAVPEELAWGSTVTNASGSVIFSGTATETCTNAGVLEGLDYEFNHRAGISATSGNTSRTLSGATYYGALDMLDYVDEQYITIHNSNMSYNGKNGDGVLNSFGVHDLHSFSAMIRKRKWLTTFETVSARAYPSGGTAGIYSGGRGVRRL